MNTPEQQQQLHKLAQAMRDGAKLRPQTRRILFKDGCSCAMGAVLEAVRPDINVPPIGELQASIAIDYYTFLVKLFPVLEYQIRTPDHKDHDLYRAIICRNDFTGMTREQIADWIPTVELVQVDN